MKRSIPFYQFEKLRLETGFVHGVSPRYYETEAGERRPLFSPRSVREIREEERRWVLSALDVRQPSLFLAKQVHGDRVVRLEDFREGVPTPEADAIITTQVERPFGVQTADCVPVLLYDPVTHSAGAVHAGRCGTGARILSKAIRQMIDLYGVDASTLWVALGPAIGGCCYEVGEECLEPFQEAFPEQWASWVTPLVSGKFLLDLIEVNRQDALTCGVLPERILESGECTACNVERWYSYRKEGETGRLVSLAMLRAR